jgi:3-hydroxyisobutyrate dehydrogenase
MTQQKNTPRIGFVGFGEAGPAVAEGLHEAGIAGIHAYDIAWPGEIDARFAERAARSQAALVETPAALSAEVDLVFSFVTCDQAVEAARGMAPALGPRHTYVDFNSTSPMIKREVGAIVEAAGARYAEAAVMALVPPHRHRVPVLLCGPAAASVAETMDPFGMRLEVLGCELGMASACKMFRSIVVKGMQSLFIESLLAAGRYGVQKRVFDSISESFPGTDWDALAHYQIGRSALHAERQGHELEEVSRTLEAMGEDPIMSRATAERLLGFARLGLKARFGDTEPASYEEVLAALEEARDPRP